MCVFKLGLDVDLKNIVTAIQCGHGEIKPAQKFSRAQLVAWVKEKVAAGHRVFTVYECCGFGYPVEGDHHHEPSGRGLVADFHCIWFDDPLPISRFGY